MGLRASRLAFTHDEAFTYNHYISKPLGTILEFDGPERSNNHLVNTLLAKVSGHFLGKRELPLRLPNLAAFAVYLVFAWLLLCRRAPPLVALSGYVLASANPLLLEMFGLCRGYGLSIAFLVAALFLADRALERPPAAHLEAGALAILGVGVLAQLVLVDSYAALLLILGANAAQGPRRARRLFAMAAVTLALAAAVVPIVRLFASAGFYHAGATHGFFEDTVKGTIFYSFMRAPYAGWARPAALGVVVACLALSAGTALVLLARRGENGAERATLGLAALPFLSAAAALTQSALLHTGSLRDRTALFFVPLFAFAATAALGWLASRNGGLHLVVSTAAAVLALASLVHLARVANTRESFLWWFDADDRRVIDDLTRLHGARPIRLGVTWYFEPSLNFYRVTRRLDWLSPITR
ncbi:MAG TPA: hypothetical protein VKF32_12470, partial [Thermoanaerobaculia bacterium]|nr:hypothetical protein [Thermoanaerobaculia bacterium]